MAILTVQEISQTGLQPAFASAAAGGDEFANDARTLLAVKNGSGAQVTVTVHSQRLCDQGFEHDLSIDVPAGEERWIGPFEKKRFSDPNGRVKVTYSAVTNVTVAAAAIQA